MDEDLNDDVACVRRIYLETAQLSGFETPKTLSSDKISANTASRFSQYYEKSDGSQNYTSEVRIPLLVAHVLGPFSWQKRPVRPFQLQLCQSLPVAASISASLRCMWIPVHFGVHFGVHFAFFS